VQAASAARVAVPAAGLFALAGGSPAKSSGDVLHAPDYPFNHKGPMSTFDAARCVRSQTVA